MGCGSAVLKEILQNKYEFLQLKFWGNIWLLQAFFDEFLLDIKILCIQFTICKEIIKKLA
jgi:hypothetical protein